EPREYRTLSSFQNRYLIFKRRRRPERPFPEPEQCFIIVERCFIESNGVPILNQGNDRQRFFVIRQQLRPRTERCTVCSLVERFDDSRQRLGDWIGVLGRGRPRTVAFGHGFPYRITYKSLISEYRKKTWRYQARCHRRHSRRDLRWSSETAAVRRRRRTFRFP